MNSVAEGVHTALAARELATRLGIAMPITEALCEVLFAGVPVQAAVQTLMSRPERAEAEDWFPAANQA
jgi:glycerol-3-phosphate dehydrogenase (NAD(P)+)